MSTNNVSNRTFSHTVSDLNAFEALVRSEGSRLWRDLPWRSIDDPYAVLVSEIMLQQTQVKRVLGYWQRFINLFPTVDALAIAETSLVLEMWQGLGYNRRALMLKQLAEECSRYRGGCLPDSVEELVTLPGVGPATAAGVIAFAYDKPCVYLETNVRSVFLHHFFADERQVPDKCVIPLVKSTCPDADIRGWYYALLDYGAFLKANIDNPSQRSKHHSHQSAFEGSRRQKRAEILRSVLACPGITEEELFDRLIAFERDKGRNTPSEEELREIVSDQISEGFFVYDGKGYRA